MDALKQFPYDLDFRACPKWILGNGKIWDNVRVGHCFSVLRLFSIIEGRIRISEEGETLFVQKLKL